MPKHEAESPQAFEIARRGYAREAVDEYVACLHEALLTSEAKAHDAMQVAAADVGERVTRVLQAALEVGEQAREVALRDTAKILEEAEQQAAELVRSAERRAEQLRAHLESLLREAEQIKVSTMELAQAEADRNLADARHQHQALQQEIQDLLVRKANTLRELGHLQQMGDGAPKWLPWEPVQSDHYEAGHAGVSSMSATPDPEVTPEAFIGQLHRPSSEPNIVPWDRARSGNDQAYLAAMSVMSATPDVEEMSENVIERRHRHRTR